MVNVTILKPCHTTIECHLGIHEIDQIKKLESIEGLL
jgi:hypothetical protein